MKKFLVVLSLLTGLTNVSIPVYAGLLSICSTYLRNAHHREEFERAIGRGALRKAGQIADVSLNEIYNMASHIAGTWGFSYDDAIELVVRAKFDGQEPYEVARLRAHGLGRFGSMMSVINPQSYTSQRWTDNW